MESQAPIVYNDSEPDEGQDYINSPDQVLLNRYIARLNEYNKMVIVIYSGILL